LPRVPIIGQMATCPSCGAAVAPDARFCARCGASVGAPAAEERKLATILFADVIGSTDLGEQLDPERLRSLLQEYFAAMSRVVEEWGGTVEKYIGDAILAVFGVPSAREDDPVRALQAANEMLAALARLNDGFEQRHGVRLAVRIGVNSGEVLAPVGARPASQFLVSGGPVNVAARLEQAAEPGSVLVGERTWAASRHAFTFSEPISLTVKGKREAVIARRLGSPLAAEQRGVSFQAPMVGRDRELETLMSLLDEAIEAELPRTVVLSGPAGIGKSRLLREFIAGAQSRHPALAVLRGRCLAAGHGITFWALGEVLRAACGISLDESANQAIDKLRRSVAAALQPLGVSQDELDATIHALATSANLVVAGNPLEQLEPEAVADEMARSWPRFLTGLAARSPVTVVIEDIHWADERMVGMLELLAARSRGRLLLVATARPEFLESRPTFAASEDLTMVALRPLTEAQSERLVNELLGDSDPLQALLMDVRQKADGNPFFLEEILQRLIDEEAIVRVGGRWRATDRAKTIRLPDTIHALLAARIDGLPAEEKSVLQQAAVVGRVFWPGSLGPTIEGQAATDLLRSLERRGLVSARPTSTIAGESEFMFRHVLIRDVAYASVPRARRARAHAETGRWLEELAADRLDEFGELLAYHYAAAAVGEEADLAWTDQPEEREQLRRRAFEVLVSSGAAARRRFAVDKALDLHGQALALAADDLEGSRAHEELGDDHEAQFHMDEAVAAYLAAVESARRSGNDAQIIGKLAAKMVAAMQRWGAFKQTPPHETIRALVAESLQRDVGERVRAELLIGSGILGGRRSRKSSRTPLAGLDRQALPGYIALVEEGLAIAQRLDDPLLLSRAYGVLGLLYWHAGDIGRYREAAEREGELLDRLPSLREKVDTLVSIASVRVESGRYRQALEAAEQAFEMAAELSPHERMHASFHVMWAAEALGEWDRVLEILPWHVQAAAAEAEVSCPNVRGGPPLGGIVLVMRGERDTAERLVPVDETAMTRDTMFDRALVARYASLVDRDDVSTAILDEMAADPSRAEYADGFEAFIEALIRLGRMDEVARFVAAGRRLAEASVLLGPIADRAEAEIAIADNRPADARPLLERALARFEELSVPFEAARTRELLAGVADAAEIGDILRPALETYERLGAEPFAERVRATLSGQPGSSGSMPAAASGIVGD
jgi:class 3 adenylate cyclase/tetratricopeptide (TPR) repeat protein